MNGLINDSITGASIGTDTLLAQKDVADKFWFEWRDQFSSLPADRQAVLMDELTLDLAKAAGNAASTHMPGWDLIAFDPSAGVNVDPVTNDLEFTRPMPALAQQVDGLGVFVALWLKTGSGNNDWTKLGAGGGGGGGLALATSIPLPDCPGGNAGLVLGTKAAAEGHQHPLVPIESVASYLYTAKLKPPADRGQFVCCFLGPHYAMGNVPMLAGFSEISPGVFEAPTAGPIPSRWLDGVDCDAENPTGIPSMVGKTVLAYYQGATSTLGDEEPRQALFILDDVGGHMEHVDPDPPEIKRLIPTKARLRIHPDYDASAEYVQGMTLQAQTGNVYGSGFFTLANASLTLWTSFFDWVYTPGPTYPWIYERKLLTAPQLFSEEAMSVTEEVEGTTASPGAGAFGEALLGIPLAFSGMFLTLTNTPGQSVLAKGPYRFNVGGVRIDSVPSVGSIVTVVAKLHEADPGSTIILSAESGPITSQTNVQMAFNGDLADDYAYSPSRRLMLGFFIRTNSTTPVKMSLLVNDGARSTWVKIPFQLNVAGGSGSFIDGDFPEAYVTDNTSASVVAESVEDFGSLNAGDTPARLDLWAYVATGFTGTFSLQVGGTRGVADGTTVASVSVGGTSTWQQVTASGTFTNPSTKTSLKLVMQSSGASDVAADGVSAVIGWGGAGGGGGVSLPIAESDVTGLVDDLSAKQATLVSGSNIKTINGTSVLGSGDIVISAGANPALVRYLQIMG